MLFKNKLLLHKKISMYKFTIFIPVYMVVLLFCNTTRAQNSDIEILRSINGIESTHTFSKIISDSHAYIATSVPLIIGTVALIEHDDDMLKTSIYIGGSLAVDVLLTYSLKSVVNRPRPYITYPDINALETLSSKSFPSGHTSYAFATATSLSIAYPKWYVIAPAYLWAGSVGYSRMNLGVHYPTDVLAGAVLGAGSAWLTWKINQWFWQKTDNKRLIGLEVYK